MNIIIFVFGMILMQIWASAQTNPFIQYPDQLGNPLFSFWIGPNLETGGGVYYFRKHLTLESQPKSFIVHVSADNRYRLYVNGKIVSWGSAVGDLNNWNYESNYIAPYLKKGENILAAQVWNLGHSAGARQISHQTTF